MGKIRRITEPRKIRKRSNKNKQENNQTMVITENIKRKRPLTRVCKKKQYSLRDAEAKVSDTEEPDADTLAQAPSKKQTEQENIRKETMTQASQRKKYSLGDAGAQMSDTEEPDADTQAQPSIEKQTVQRNKLRGTLTRASNEEQMEEKNNKRGDEEAQVTEELDDDIDTETQLEQMVQSIVEDYRSNLKRKQSSYKDADSDDSDRDPDYEPDTGERAPSPESPFAKFRPLKLKNTVKTTTKTEQYNTLQLPPLKPGLSGKSSSNHRPRKVMRRQHAKKPRSRRQCFLCPLQVVHLPRHLREAHDVGMEASREVSNLQKARSTASSKRPFKICPIDGCDSVVQRLDMHLQKQHNLTPDQSAKIIPKAERITETPYEVAKEQPGPSRQTPPLQPRICTGNIIRPSIHHGRFSAPRPNLPQANQGTRPYLPLVDQPLRPYSPRENRLPRQIIPLEPNFEETSCNLNIDLPVADVSETFSIEPHIRPSIHRSRFSAPRPNLPQANQRTGPYLPLVDQPLRPYSPRENRPPRQIIPLQPDFEETSCDLNIDLPVAETFSIEPHTTPQADVLGISLASSANPTTTLGSTTLGSVTEKKSVTSSASSRYRSFKDVPLLSQFRKWLESAERGKSTRTALQHAVQVFSIWKSVDLDMDLASIQDQCLLNQFWLEQNRRTKLPGTLKSYLGSLKEFLLFLLAWVNPGHFNENKIQQTLQAISRWNNTLHKDARKRAVERAVIDSEERVEPDDLKTFMDSTVAKTAREYLAMIRNGDLTEVSSNVFCLVRNFVIFIILATNAQRVGAIANFQMRTLKTALQKGECTVCTIAHHKTGYMTPVVLAFPKDIWKLIQTFVKMRRHVPLFSENWDEDDAYLFFSGGYKTPPIQMTDSAINKAINNLWQSTQPKIPHITATKIRKAVATNVRDQYPKERENLASHMTHKASTADQYYLLHNRQSESVKITKIISKVMMMANEAEDQQDARDEPIQDEQSAQEHAVVEEHSEAVVEEHCEVEEHVKSVEQTDSEEQASSEQVEELEHDESEPEIRPHGRRIFSNEESLTLQSLCRKVIEGECPISQKLVEHFLLKSTKGKSLLQKFPIKKLTDRVRTARREKIRKQTKK